jgi:RNA polymerase sigma-70 factor (ECF subfamily)
MRNVMQPTDRDLMLAAAKGDVEKFGVLFDRYHQRLFEFFYRLSGDVPSSEDLVQDVFLRMLRYRRSFREKSEFRAWMYQIARTVRIDRFKKRWESDGVLGDQLAAAKPQTTFSAPDRALEQGQESALLQHALLELPEAKREILILARFQELKYEQIAALLDLDVGVVKVRVHRATAELRAIFLRMTERNEACDAMKSGKTSPTT